MALSRGLHQYLDDWLIRSQSQEEAQVNTQAVVDLTQSLGWIINLEKSELKPTQVFLFVGYEYHLDSALVKPTQERWLKLDLILRLMSKHVLTARCLMSLFGLLASTEKMVPEGRLHTRPFQFHLKDHWRYPRLVAEPCKRDERYSTIFRCLKRRLGRSLRSKFYQGSVVRPGKKGTHKPPRVEIGFTGLSKLQGPVSQPNSASCNGQLNSGSLHKQTRRNSLRGDVPSPVEDRDMVSSLSHNIKSQTHSRVSECDGRPVQVEPGAVNRMASTSTGVKTDLLQVVHCSCRSICHSSEPQTSTVRVSPVPDPKAWDIDALNINWMALTSYAYPPTALLHRVIQNQAMPLPDHCNSPRLTRDALVLGPSARDPTATSGVNNTSQTVPRLCVPQQSTTSQPPRLVSRSGQLQEQGFSVEVAERIAAPQRSSTRTIYKSKWALFENGAEKIRWISPLHL